MNTLRGWFVRNFSDPQVVVLAVLLASGVAVVVFLGDLLAPVLAGLVIAYLLDGPTEALKRRGLPREDIHALRAAFRDLGAEGGSFQERAQKVAETYQSDQVREIVEFILGATDRSFLTPR